MKRHRKSYLPFLARTFANLLLLAVAVTVIIGIYRCPIYTVFGIPCAGCGMTRAYLALLRLNFKEAFQYHELFPIPAILLCYHLLRNKLRLKPKWEYILMFSSLFALLVRWVIKIFMTI